MQLADDLPLLNNQGLLLAAGLIPRTLILEGGVNESLACKGKGKRTSTGPRC